MTMIKGPVVYANRKMYHESVMSKKLLHLELVSVDRQPECIDVVTSSLSTGIRITDKMPRLWERDKSSRPLKTSSLRSISFWKSVSCLHIRRRGGCLYYLVCLPRENVFWSISCLVALQRLEPVCCALHMRRGFACMGNMLILDTLNALRTATELRSR
jgi:hypothetical protein